MESYRELRDRQQKEFNVPVEVIEQVIEKHGGWFDARIPFA